MSNYLLGSYDPAHVQIVFIYPDGKSVKPTGWADGEMVTVESNEEYFNNYEGTLGEVSRAVNRKRSGKITIRLQSTSKFIKEIMNMRYADGILAANGIGVPPVLAFQIVDPSSNDTIFATQCWLQKDTSHAWGNEVGVREYEFYSPNISTAPNEALSVLQSAANITGIL
jgi:hypothetical protein